MSQPIDFKFYLRKKNGATFDYYFVNASNNVAFTNSATPTNALTYAPDEWLDMILTWERKFTYHGTFRAFTLGLKFIKSNAHILRHLFFNAVTEGDCQLYIEKFNDDVSVWGYEPYYVGEIDFSRYRAFKNYVTCDIMEGGFLADLNAHGEINYNIDVPNDSEVVWVKLDGVELFGKLLYGFSNSGAHSWNFANPKISYQDIFYINTEGTQAGLVGNDELFEENNLSSGFNEGNYFLYSGRTQTVNIELSIIAQFANPNIGAFPPDLDYGIFIIENNATTSASVNVATLLTIPTLTSGTNTTTILFTNSINLTVKKGHSYSLVVLCASSNINPTATTNYQIFSGDLRINTAYRADTTYCPALRPKRLLQNVLAKATAQGTSTISNYLDTVHNNKVLTSGDCIRGLFEQWKPAVLDSFNNVLIPAQQINLDQKAFIKTAFKELHSSYNAVLNTGLHYKASANELIYENKEIIYNANVQSIDLGKVKNLEINPLTEEMFSKLRIGYGEFTYDDVNGRDELNQVQQYESPLIRVTTEKDLTSKYRADCYGIEFTRINTADKQSSDAGTDNDTFWLHIQDTPSGTITNPITNSGTVDVYDLDRSLSLLPNVVTGLLAPLSVFNMQLSPKRNLLRHGNYLHSLLHQQDAKQLKFTSAVKKDSMAIAIGNTAPYYIENSNVDISTLNTKLFVPFVLTVTLAEPLNIYSVMQNVPLGYALFNWNGNDYKGFILKATQAPALRNEQTFTLLACVDNDFSKLEY